jgi:Asp/Glu/hydantoin racemase
MSRECEKAVADDGADVIIAYGGPKTNEFLKSRIDVPIINILEVHLKVTEMFARLGLSQSKRAFPRPRRVLEWIRYGSEDDEEIG